ncbi:ABC transporter permease subunit [Saliniradius amylolyticus]|uniref:ABC transporter permease subunit n=1 Tax=Saliniradius amylolyticus TaxID=2183582 RepID=UPI0013A5346B|nr:ABC transporter permease subunit [Saliniradius amylolyticus]
MARRVIAAGGWMVLVTLGLLIWHLVYVVWPLLYSPSVQMQQQWPLPTQAKVLLPGAQANNQPALLLNEDCQLSLADPQTWHTQAQFPLPCSTRVKAREYLGSRYVFELSGEGVLRIMQLRRRGQDWQKQQRASFYAPHQDIGGKDWQVALSEHWYGLAVKTDKHWAVKWVSRHNPLQSHTQNLPVSGKLTLLPSQNFALVADGNKLHLFGANQQSYTFDKPIEFVRTFADDKAVMLGLEGGEWQKWSLVNEQGQFRLRQSYVKHQQQTLLDLQTIPGKDLLILLTEQRQLVLLLGTTGEILLRQSLPQNADKVYSVGDSLQVWDSKTMQRWQIRDADSIVSFESLWQPVLYDGYAQADYVWQSTTANDEISAKYSLVPLVIGSLKAALVALLVAVPLALGAAVYTAYFVPQRLRNWLKPGIEMLEAIPSVVIGFIAAIWLTPVVEEYLFGLMLFLLSLPFVMVSAALSQRSIAKCLPPRWQTGWELLLLIPVLALLLWLCLSAGNDWQPEVWNQWVGNYAQDSQYSSKNAIVIALALGIAIAPSIYSLAEDAIYEVPSHLRQASLALGATRIQTLSRVVLVTAYPGIFSAVMLGLSRAFGETMILLMVTGNTPVPDWDLFSGIRTLTANIAIELPESKVGSIHYRILFFTALLLFGFTFLVNTLAELIRRHLRRRYQRV